MILLQAFVINSWPHILQQRLSYTDSNCSGYATQRAADTVSNVKFLNLINTTLHQYIYKPISKININITHHGVHSDNFFGRVTTNCDIKLPFITISGKSKQPHLYKNINLLSFNIMDWARGGNFQISEILKSILPHTCAFNRVFLYFGIL
jgi:hypothetical protein